ncbi:MAG: hypothetical protein RLN70_01615 [Rhodospirillaceae bacterium]
MRFTTSLAAAAVSAMAFGATAAAQSADAGAALRATPIGVMFKLVRIGEGVNVPGQSSVQPRERLIFADENDLPVYTFANDEPGVSNCYDACAEKWFPLPARADAQPVGEWSVIDRRDGIRQWAFNDRPLYTYVEDAGADEGGGGMYFRSSQPKGHDVDGVWHVFEIQPEEWLRVPQGVTVEEILTAPGQVYATDQRMPLYTFSGSPDADQAFRADWTPFTAYQLALPVGDFTVIARNDGIHQWALNGRPLYTYDGDVEYGDSNGKGLSDQFDLAWVMKYYMPDEVGIRKDQKRGGVLVEASTGKSLYARDRAFADMQGGHHARGGTRGNPSTGKSLGTSGCDAECEMTWLPLIAPENAKPSGYWTVVDREDGRKQWAYQGYVMYTYANEGPGVVTGHDIYDLTVNDSTENLQAANLGLYWRVTSP